jgi:hypothetical protein
VGVAAIAPLVSSCSCWSGFDLEPSFDVSAQSYDQEGPKVYLRVDFAPQGTHTADAIVEGETLALGAVEGNGKPELSAQFRTRASAYDSLVRYDGNPVATIHVPGAFVVTDVPPALKFGDPLIVTVSPPPEAAVQVTLRIRPNGCLEPGAEDGVTITPTLVTPDGHVTFDTSVGFGVMDAPACDQPLGIRYESTGIMSQGRQGTAHGLREQGVVVHLVHTPQRDAGPDVQSDADVAPEADASPDAGDSGADADLD